MVHIANREAIERFNPFFIGKASIELIVEKRKSLSKRERQRLERLIQHQAR